MSSMPAWFSASMTLVNVSTIPRTVPSLASMRWMVGSETPADRRRFDSQQLFGSGHEVEIAHAGAIYRLRRTALGKLILTK